jgi:hypothetical protein
VIVGDDVTGDIPNNPDLNLTNLNGPVPIGCWRMSRGGM